jgi:hypothetical protein
MTDVLSKVNAYSGLGISVGIPKPWINPKT